MKSSLNWDCAVPVLKHCYGGYHSRETKDILGGTKSWGTKKLLVPTVVLMGPSCLLPSALTFVVQPTTKVQYALLNLVEYVEIYMLFGGDQTDPKSATGGQPQDLRTGIVLTVGISLLYPGSKFRIANCHPFHIST